MIVLRRIHALEARLHCNAWYRLGVAIIVAFVLFLAGDTAINRLTQDTRIPVTIISTGFVEESAVPGGAATLVVDRIKVRDCPLTVFAHWLDRDGLQVKGAINPGGVVGVGETQITVRISLPPSLIPGREWAYAPVLSYECDEKTYVVRQTPAWIQVVSE